MLDNRYAIETPEGIDLILRPAGPMPRILAYIVDLLIRWGIMLALGIILAFFGAFGAGLISIFYFLLEWFYPLFFEVFNQGMTPGKKSLHIHVIHDDGTPVNWNSSLIRNLLRAVDFLPFAYCAGLISMVINGHFKRLGDLAAGTIVVYKQKKESTSTESELGMFSLPIALSSEEQRIILDFSERRTQLSDHRQQELAEILTPVTDKNGQESINILVKIANSLKGSR